MRGSVLSLLFCLVVSPVLAARGAVSATVAERPAIVYLGILPGKIEVVDLNKGAVIDQITVNPTDVVRRLILSPDRKKLIVATMDHNGFATVDLATRKVSDYFSLDHDNVKVRLSGETIDPTGQYIYAIATTVTKNLDYYEISKPQFVVVDLQAKKIVRSADLPKGEENPGYRGAMRVSPDGKYLYLFRNSGIQVFDTSDFKLVKTIDLKRPADPQMMDLTFSLEDDPNEAPGKVVTTYRASDPFVHQEIFGIGVLNLSDLSYQLTPLGPVTTTMMTPIMLSPDRKLGYTAVVYGENGNRITQFWVIDMKTKKIIAKKLFTGRTRFTFGLSADGTKLLIYGASYRIEVYDAKTLEMTKTIPLDGDPTTNLVVMPEGE